MPAGGPELSLVAEALGIIYLRAIDDASNKRLFLSAIPGNVLFRLAGRRDQPLQREPFELGVGGLAARRGPYEDGIGAMLAVVVADDKQALLGGAEAFVELEGFLPVQQRVAITTLDNLELGRQVNEVRVRSEHDLGPLTCRVQARQPPPPPGARRGPSRIGRLTTSSGATVVRRGQWAPPGEWWFEALPAGVGTFEVFDDGGNPSQPVEVTLSADRPAEIELSYAGPASFAVQVVDREGREHCGLALGCTPLDPPGPGTGLIEAMAWPSFDQEGKVQRRCMQLPPGEYRFDASSYEVGAGITIVRLEADTHTLVRIVLTTPPSALSLPR